MKTTIITVSVAIIAFVAIFWTGYIMASNNFAANAKADQVISFINQQLSKQQLTNTK